jgi:hypothetical protein
MSKENGLERLINGKIKSTLDLLETSTYGEVSAVNTDSVDVYLPQRDETLPDIPVFTLQGGGEYIQFPITVGDKCLVSFSKDSALDWISGNDIDSTYSFDLSNGFALVGLDTLANPLPLTSITTLKVSKVKIENSTAELIATLSDIVDKLNDTLTNIQTLTVTCTGPGNPSSVPINAAAFGTIATQLAALKTNLDSFKE